MAAEQPGIVKRQNHRRLLAQPGKRPQVKVAAVQVMAVNYLWAFRRQVQEPPRAGEVEILISTSNL